VARLFPQLEVLGLLGAGGMGAVYKARQRELDRIVALKIVPSLGRGAVLTDRFQREARALARLSHPHIVAVYEFGETADLRYFIMEYVDGANLRQLARAGRLAPREALQLVPQICDALQYAHDEGVVHRDIKPENVLVDRRGRVKIADFGLAKITVPEAAASRLTQEGQVMGTPHYMAPEQIERPLAVDHRADIYSLGVVLYELLTGDLPLGKFPPPSRKVEVDVRIDEVVLRALENDPEQRYQRASEVKSQVESIGEAGERRRVAGVRRGVVGAVALGLLAVVAAVAWKNRHVDPPAEVAAVAVQSAERDARTGLMVASLPGRGRVELLAVGEAGAARNRWWRPDGTPASETHYELTDPAESWELGKVSKDLIFRLDDLPAGSDGPYFDAFPAAGAGSGGEVARDGRRLPGHVQARFAWPADVRRAAVRVGFALEPWRTVALRPAGGKGGGARRPRAGDPDWRVTFQPEARTEEGALQVSVVFGPQDKGWSHRLVAIDRAGTPHPARHGRGSPIESFMLWTYTFPDVEPGEVASFELQVRPVHWVEFPDVALAPSTPLPEPAVVWFLQPELRTVAGFIDLDSGRTGELPAGTPVSAFFADLPAHILEVEAQGWDAAAGPEGLHFLGTTFDEVPATAWEAWTPMDVIGRLKPPVRSARQTSVSGSGHRVLCFRTREGGCGLLRLGPPADGSADMMVELKRVQR
jgi:tRNA A-37 threonylcarbamoyl transferase component Bud32